MEKMIKMYCINKAIEFAKKNIYRSEIVNKGKAGVEKFNAVAENFWDRVESYIEKEKKIDRKWLPDNIENFGEEAIHAVIKTLRAELEPQKLIQDIFNAEKKENPQIF